MSPRLAYSRPQYDAHKSPYDYQRQRDIMRGIPRMMSPYLSAPEEKLLGYVFSQSVDMNREFLLTTYERLEHGDPGAKTNGTGYSKRHLQRIAGALVKRRFMTVQQTGRGLKITPNPDWKPGSDTPLASEKRKQVARKAANTRRENSPAKPKLISTLWQRPRRGDTDVHSRGDTDVHSEWTRMSTTKEEAKTEETKKEETDYRSPSGDREPVSSNSNSSTSVRVRVRQRPPLATSAKKENPQVPAAPPSGSFPARGSLQPSEIEMTYRAAFKQVYSDQPGVFPTEWTIKEKGRIKSAVLAKWEGTPEEAHDYFDWIVRDFSRLRNDVFGWMKRPAAPVAPDALFIARWHRDLLSAYRKRKQDDWIAGFDTHEAREFHRLTVAQGMSPEEARMKIAEERAALRLREEVERGKAEAAMLMKAAQIAKAKAEKTPMGIHPRSEIARRLAELEARAALTPVDYDQPIDLISALEEGERFAKENDE